MTIFRNELRINRVIFCVWTAAMAFMLGICVFIFPQMTDIGEAMASMGSFSEAFGMDQIDFGKFEGFFAVECGNIMSLGGAFLAALLGIQALGKEEKEHTAEFLLTQPVSRFKVVTEKYSAVVIQLAVMNLIVMGSAWICAGMIGEKMESGDMILLMLAYFLMEVEIASITFAISSFGSRGNIGAGLGLAAVMYFLNLLSNIIEETKFLKYLTPLGFADSAYIITEQSMELKYLIVGMILTVAAVVTAYVKYLKKDIS